MPRLTQPTIDKHKPDPSGKVRTIADSGCPGLYLLVHPTRKAWVVMYRRLADRKQRKLTLPGFPSLATAHKLAREALNKVAEGGDPATEKQEAKRAVSVPRADLVDDAFRLFLDKHVRTKKGQPIRESTRRETARLLGFKRDPSTPDTWIKSGGGVLAEWRSNPPLNAIKPADVRDLLDVLAERGPVMANRTLTALKTCFSFHMKRDRAALPFSPCDGIDPPAAEGGGRERVLSDEELAALWRAAEGEANRSVFGPMVQLLVLTGCRRDEVRDATWAEFDLSKREWLIPGQRTKNGRDHLVPLSDSAVTILEALPRIAGRAKLLFTTTGETSISGLSKIKARVAKAMADELGQEPAPWTLHDLRRTLATGLQKLRFPVEVSEAVLNHRGGTVSGVAAIYARHDYAAEKREALDAWARHVAGIVEGGPMGNVIELRTRA
jgi:integrase